MAIKKPIWNDKGVDTGKPPITTPSFSFAPNDGLAEMIVEAWANKDIRKQLLERNPKNSQIPSDAAVQLATSWVNTLGFNLKRAVVISEAEHDNDYIMQKPEEVVFVLPDRKRLGMAPSGSLLSTAKLLMACTPNGI